MAQHPAAQSFPGAHSPVKYHGDSNAPMAFSSFASQSGQPAPQQSHPAHNGAHAAHSPFRSFNNESHPQPGGVPNRFDKPQIYTAVYSGVKVYEMEANGVACMRRRADGWLNATQILKVAGIDKGKRTKVLEKEILTGEHEKVQGGYGKYQGTWINYERGREFCRQYGVEDVLLPLLEHDRSNDGSNAAAQTQDTPTKEQAMAANRKRFYNNASEQRNGNPAQGGTFFSNISPNVSVALSAMEKAARLNSPAPRPGVVRAPSASNLNRPQHLGPPPSGSQQSLISENSFNGDMSIDSAYGTQQFRSDEPPRKRMRTDDTPMAPPSLPMDTSMRTEATEPNEPFVYHQHGVYPDPSYDGPPITMSPLPAPDTPEGDEKRALLLDLFADQSRIDYATHPALTQLSVEDYDLPLDASANTALHWAATLARIPLVRLLLQKGANMWRGNAAGQSALISAVLVNNCSEHSCFPHLLEMLGPLIEARDAQGRTILHHIAVACGIKGRAPSSKYYLEALLEFLVRSANHNSSISADPEETGGVGAVQSSKGPMSLMKFLSTIVNAQDKGGNTALNLVARIGNRSIIQQLLEIRADPNLPNHKGVSARDFGVGANLDGEGYNGDVMSFSQPGNQPPASQTTERQSQTGNAEGDVSMASSGNVIEEQNQDVISSLTNLLQTNLQNHKLLLAQKIAQIDALTSQIQDLVTQQATEQQRFTDLQSRVKSREERDRKITNLSRLLESSPPPPSAQKDDPYNPTALATLSTPHLSALARALERNNAALSTESRTLSSRSADTERLYRRVISLCTGVPDANIDDLLPGLVAAVESEAPGPVPHDAPHGMGNLRVGRVRDFLALVDGVNATPPVVQGTAAERIAAAASAAAAAAGMGSPAGPAGRFAGHRRGPSTASPAALGAGVMVEAA
ncbi:hypothetical protein K461DRAFT_254608 [Myriangium duriaei CBS 260.36]|uniref:HTH APSES-type domain-containing protein n=1 Tax=Myriangium duriaei CBS 260.36 TaxID=1168546 RepID=A0A9P4J704_9PEZI|nr:hypothetical protein K461DRAFT_254608 [Myriangium duriaei CBS 260.36]